MSRSVSAVRRRADWRRVDQLYKQVVEILNDPEQQNQLPDLLMGSLAESVGRLLAHYDGDELLFMKDLFLIWSHIEGLKGSSVKQFQRLYHDNRLERFPEYNPHTKGRRRPKPFEASIETCRRLADLNRVRDVLTPFQSGGILGGSVSYGRFFNVCGATIGKSSDTDLLLVLPDYDNLPEVSSALESVHGLDNSSLGEFRKRIRIFHHVRRNYRHCIFSHKLYFWGDTHDPHLSHFQMAGQYMLSLHVISWFDFDFIILKDKPVLQPGANGKLVRYLWDYRDTDPTRPDNQRSFGGMDITVRPRAKEVEHGFLSRVRVCHIESDRYYPGLHQNLILPQFEIRWEAPSKRLHLPILSFRWKIVERLQEERRLRPFEFQSLSLCHTRSEHFSPHITRRADRE